MGQNLILNMNDKGFTVAAYNRTTSSHSMARHLTALRSFGKYP